jgi:DNA-binding transcriptional regulator of glucitol operon
MPSATSRPRWWFLVTPRWLAWHAFVVLAAWGMLWLGDWQFHRAESGNALSWAYTFEWPVFTIFGVLFWAKTIVDEWQARGSRAGERSGLALTLPPTAHSAGGAGEVTDADDPELAAYNDYLARLDKGERVRRFQGGPAR